MKTKFLFDSENKKFFVLRISFPSIAVKIPRLDLAVQSLGSWSLRGYNASSNSLISRCASGAAILHLDPLAFATSMSFKAIFKTLAFLIILFVVLYVGLNNRENISFSFPVAQIKLNAPAAIIFFGVFVVGVLAGTLLHSSNGSTSKSSGKK